MYERTRNFLLRILKVPLEPHPPLGEPASLRVFRAGRSYFKLRLFQWGLAQTLALAGIVFWAVVLIQVEDAAQVQKQERAAQRTPAPTSPAPVGAPTAAPADPSKNLQRHVDAGQKSLVENPPAANSGSPAAQSGRKHRTVHGWAAFKQVLAELALLLPDWTFPLIWLLKVFGFAAYLVQIPITYAVRRLDYEMHWYMVTDRSLRLRTGIWKVQELTMSFANLQQVVVTQGPLQRVLGLADVRVQSAGGGGAEHTRAAQQNSLHSGYFHSVDNAVEIRDLILERLRRFRESGLGDPDEVRRTHPPRPGASGAGPSAAGSDSALLAAAREFRDESRALRIALG